MKLTIFYSDITSSKVPKSPFDDNTFIFDTKEVDLNGALELLREEFVLNRSFEIKEKRLRKTKFHLKDFLTPETDFIIIDIDKVSTALDESSILNFFKEKDYYIGVIPSRSYDGINSFNMKCVLKVRASNNIPSIRLILSEIAKGIFPHGKVDFSSIREASHQAPSYSRGVLYFHEGKNIPEAFLVEEVDVNFQSDSEILETCFEAVRARGFRVEEYIKEKDLYVLSHPNEKTPRGYFIFGSNPFIVHHFNPEKTFSIFKDVIPKAKIQKYFDEMKKKEREEYFNQPFSKGKIINVNERYLKVNPEIQDMIKEWKSKGGLLRIKSPMGTGKSNIIEYVIKDTPRVLFITNRISVAKDFHTRYGIKLYSESEYFPGDSLITQFDSLWRYSLKEFDYIIIDEFMSVMLHAMNDMNDTKTMNRIKLFYALKKKNVLIADSFLFGFENKILSHKNIFSIQNSYRDDVEIIEFQEMKNILAELKNKGKEAKSKGKVITVSCTNKITGKVATKILEDEGLNVIALSSESTDEEKEDLYKAFESEEAPYDAIVYTPTLTVGVNILNDVEYHFHIDESTSADVISSLQMIKRSRKAEHIYVFIKERKRRLETSRVMLDKEFEKNMSLFFKNGNSFYIQVDENGDFSISNLGKFMNEIEALYNTLENDHKHSFFTLLKHQIKSVVYTSVGGEEIDFLSMKKYIKESEMKEMKNILESLEENEYTETALSSVMSMNGNGKNKVVKLMAEINELMEDIPKKELKRITEMEINSKFKYINSLKHLKFFLTNNESDIKKFLNWLISEGAKKDQIAYFSYILTLKRKGYKLKDKITLKEIKEMNEAHQGYDFRRFLKSVGYIKRSNLLVLPKEMLKDIKYLKS